MLNQSKSKISLRILLFISASLIAAAQAATLPETAKLLPPETVFMVDIANFSQAKAQFDKTDLYKLYKDPAIGPFAEQVKGKWDEMIKELDENNFIRTLIDDDMLPQGRVALAVVLNEQSKPTDEPPVLLITQWGQENIAKVKESVAKMMEKNVELGGRKIKSEQFQNVTIETAVDEDDEQFSYFFMDDCLIGTTDNELLKFVAAHAQGASSPTLAAEAEYQNMVRATGPYHDVDLYLNIKQLMKTAIASDTSGQAQMMISALGLDNVSGFGMSLGITRTPANQWAGKGLLKNSGAKKGLLKMLDGKGASLNAPEFIPASMHRVSLVNLSVSQIYSELSNILSAINPMFSAFLYMPLVPAGPQGEPPVMLKEGVVDHLGSQIVVAQGIKKPFSNEAIPTEYIVAIATSNRGALEKSLSELHSKRIAVGDPEARKELLGQTIYLLKLGAMPFFNMGGAQPMQTPPAGAVSAAVPKFAFTVTDTHLILGLQSSVEQAVRTLRGGESVNSAKWFKTAKAAGPSTALMAGFEDNRAAMEYLWWMLKQVGNTANIKPGSVMAVGPAGMLAGSGLDFSVLPEFEKVSKYFGLALSYVVSREDGFFMEFKSVDSLGD